MKRCSWVNENNLKYVKYHDEEWGIAHFDDAYLFEMLLLESFQAGLSWECILNKREAFRKAFSNFNYQKIANYQEKEINKLLENKDIIRNKLKIKAAITNAQVFLKIQKEYQTFSNYIWHFTNKKQIRNKKEHLVTSPLSDEISLDLRKRGMKFVGSKIIYSYLQAIGITNDHEKTCFLFKKDDNE